MKSTRGCSSLCSGGSRVGRGLAGSSGRREFRSRTGRTTIMTIWIALAWRHGSTREIGDAIAEELRASDYRVDVQDVTDAPTIENYAAIIIGSAVYLGRWMHDAVQFIDRTQAPLMAKPV